MMILRTFVFFASSFLLGAVNGQFLRNITVDDTDPSITYVGSWGNGGGDSDSYGGSHRWANQSGAYATFTFTGVAVYYLMPVFDGYQDGVSTLLALDSRPAQVVNLNRVGSEPTVSAVRWGATGLTSGTHTVVVSLGGLANWGEVDAFTYTVEDSSSVPPDTPTPTLFQGSASANAPYPTASNNAQALATLGDCAPCGNSKCSFSAEGRPSSGTYLLVVGKPVSNCGKGNNETVTSQYTTEMEVSETWSVDTSIGISYVGLDLHGGAGWSSTASVRASQQVSMSIGPGKMAALVATVNYKKTSGNMLIDSVALDFASIQPTGISGYSVEYSDCGNLFSAFTFSSTNCTAKSAAYTNRYSPMFMGLMGATVLWMI